MADALTGIGHFFTYCYNHHLEIRKIVKDLLGLGKPQQLEAPDKLSLIRAPSRQSHTTG